MAAHQSSMVPYPNHESGQYYKRIFDTLICLPLTGQGPVLTFLTLRIVVGRRSTFYIRRIVTHRFLVP